MHTTQRTPPASSGNLPPCLPPASSPQPQPPPCSSPAARATRSPSAPSTPARPASWPPAATDLILTPPVVADPGTPTSEPEGRPSVAWSGDRLFVGWGQWNKGSYRFAVAGADLTVDGIALGLTTFVPPGNTGNPFNPQIAWSGGGLDLYWAQDDANMRVQHTQKQCSAKVALERLLAAALRCAHRMRPGFVAPATYRDGLLGHPHFGRLGPRSFVVHPGPVLRPAGTSCCGGGFQRFGSFSASASAAGSAQQRNEMK